ncbi:hypothetical protein BpHYR1_006292 [Brachionus plicatilis]|uniref:Uncharacterized protein n=1 Tax=Brachionus plicatilis TaxID=10195 RepID=A0A3M7RFL6_BRAPC|nr:hypothetical protein BpHYR1_006292 [Brachionus plicatilis]
MTGLSLKQNLKINTNKRYNKNINSNFLNILDVHMKFSHILTNYIHLHQLTSCSIVVKLDDPLYVYIIRCVRLKYKRNVYCLFCSMFI